MVEGDRRWSEGGRKVVGRWSQLVGTWSGGRHTTGAGFRQDCVKYNLASLEGWTVMRFTSDMVKKGLALEQIVAYLDQEESQASSGEL